MEYGQVFLSCQKGEKSLNQTEASKAFFGFDKKLEFGGQSGSLRCTDHPESYFLSNIKSAKSESFNSSSNQFTLKSSSSENLKNTALKKESSEDNSMYSSVSEKEEEKYIITELDSEINGSQEINKDDMKAKSCCVCVIA